MNEANEPRIRSIAEAEVVVRSLWHRVEVMGREVRDHDQRFQTLQTPFWRRVLFWLDGWPWHDLNAPRRSRRPWHR